MDRNLYKSDKKLANQGWRAMRKALDQEMPEERRRRPAVLIWIFALLVPAAGALGWLMFGRHAGAPSTADTEMPATVISPSPKAAIQDKPIANIPENNARIAVSNDANEIISSQKRENGPQITEPRHSIPTYQAATSHTDATPARETLLSNTSQAQPQQTGEISATEPERTESKSELQDISNPAPENTIPDIAIGEPAIPAEIMDSGQAPGENVVSGVSAPSAGADTASVAPFAMPPKPIDPLRDAQKSTWAFGANAGVMSDVTGDYAGAGAGLSAEWQPLKKWGLRSGLGYQFRQLGAEERPVVSLTAMSYVDITGDLRVAADNNNFHSPGSVQGSAEPSQVYVPVGRLHRIEMPVLAFWQPFSKLRVFGGVAVGNNLYVETGNRTLNNNKVYTVLDGDASKNLNDEVSEQFREWDTRLSIGLGFKPIRHLELGLFFHKPLPTGLFKDNEQDLIPNSAVTDFQQSISNKSSGLSATGLFNFTASWFF